MAPMEIDLSEQDSGLQTYLGLTVEVKIQKRCLPYAPNMLQRLRHLSRLSAGYTPGLQQLSSTPASRMMHSSVGRLEQNIGGHMIPNNPEEIEVSYICEQAQQAGCWIYLGVGMGGQNEMTLELLPLLMCPGSQGAGKEGPMAFLAWMGKQKWGTTVGGDNSRWPSGMSPPGLLQL
eukprot:scaffold209291_cov22-Tisochrysis_lutea.AAC.1